MNLKAALSTENAAGKWVSRGQSPVTTEMGPEDRNDNFGAALTKAGQGSHSKETNLPKHIVRTGLGHGNT